MYEPNQQTFLNNNNKPESSSQNNPNDPGYNQGRSNVVNTFYEDSGKTDTLYKKKFYLKNLL